MMPMTVSASPFTVIGRPIAFGSERSVRDQKLWEMTTTGSRPGVVPSSSRNARPMAGRIPSTSKKFGVTSSPNTRTGSPVVRAFMAHQSEGRRVLQPVHLRGAEIHEVGIGHAQVVAAAGHTPHDDEAILRRHTREGAQQDRLHPAEDRGVRADAETENQHRDGREPWTTNEHAPGELEIVDEHARAPVEKADGERVWKSAGGAREDAQKPRDALAPSRASHWS